MLFDWQGAWASVIHHPLFGIGITLGAYQLVLAAFEKTRWIFLQPVLVSMLLVIGVLVGCGLTYAEYRKSTEILSILLGPATVALAVPLYLNLRRIRQLFWPIFTTLVIGGVVATGMGVLLGWWFGAEHMILMTMAPKSVTSPIAMLVAEQIGGVAALAAVFVLITGVIGAIFGPALLTRLGVHSPEARGMALGMTAHAVGTAVAMQENDECGAFAAQFRDQRQRQETVSNGAAKWRLRGFDRVDMNELIITGGFGEQVDAFLIDGEPFGTSEFLADIIFELCNWNIGH